MNSVATAVLVVMVLVSHPVHITLSSPRWESSRICLEVAAKGKKRKREKAHRRVCTFSYVHWLLTYAHDYEN